MKVLLVWEDIPETTKFYLLDGNLAAAAIAAHRQIINSTDESEHASRLCDMLEGIEPISDDHPFEIDEKVTVVYSGFYL